MIGNELDGSTDLLSELGRTTTAYHDAPIDRMEDARQEYLEALRAFNMARQDDDPGAEQVPIFPDARGVRG